VSFNVVTVYVPRQPKLDTRAQEFLSGSADDDYIKEKVAIKARQFNSILNKQAEAEEQESLERYAAEYRKQTGGT
tara:strand:+ start:257 stop:481 length:225 start_codon:yes stop_codon:yes gene_type:complete